MSAPDRRTFGARAVGSVTVMAYFASASGPHRSGAIATRETYSNYLHGGQSNRLYNTMLGYGLS
jgi:hypothetical protein